MRIEWVPEGFPRREELMELAGHAARELGLGEQISGLRMVLDAPEFEEGGFWEIDPREDGRWGVLYASPRDVLAPPGYGVDVEIGLDEERLAELPRERVELLRADRWIHRNLLQLEDILQGRIDPGAIPKGESAAFQVCWDVWTDGRLKLRALPGISLPERRRVFFRAFAAGGMLLPRHWEVFHQLWEDRLGAQEGILSAVKRLPFPAS